MFNLPSFLGSEDSNLFAYPASTPLVEIRSFGVSITALLYKAHTIISWETPESRLRFIILITIPSFCFSFALIEM